MNKTRLEIMQILNAYSLICAKYPNSVTGSTSGAGDKDQIYQMVRDQQCGRCTSCQELLSARR